jgi:Ca2+-binding EF-hand superfamily protein
MRKLALLAKTRGVDLRECFQDCERSDATSLMTPRYGGKVTPAQFKQHFPFVKDFREKEVNMLLERYKTFDGNVHFQAMDKEIASIETEPAHMTTTLQSTRRLSPEFPASPTSMMEDGTGGGWFDRPMTPAAGGSPLSSRGGPRRCWAPQGDFPRESDVAVAEKVKALVAERRLRLHELFLDFDKLRKGTCTLGQVKSVFTVLRIELSAEEHRAIGRLYDADGDGGGFRYRDFVNEVNEVSFSQECEMTLDESLEPRPYSSRAGRRITPLNSSAEAKLESLREWLRKRIDQRTLPLKQAFQDFDRVRTGHVTVGQFSRIMNMLNIHLDPALVDLLCKAYCDTDSRKEFNYIDFCDAVGRQSAQDVYAAEQINLPYCSSPSKYFTKQGEVLPAPPYRFSQRPFTR